MQCSDFLLPSLGSSSLVPKGLERGAQVVWKARQPSQFYIANPFTRIPACNRMTVIFVIIFSHLIPCQLMLDTWNFVNCICYTRYTSADICGGVFDGNCTSSSTGLKLPFILFALAWLISAHHCIVHGSSNIFQFSISSIFSMSDNSPYTTVSYTHLTLPTIYSV